MSSALWEGQVIFEVNEMSLRETDGLLENQVVFEESRKSYIGLRSLRED